MMAKRITDVNRAASTAISPLVIGICLIFLCSVPGLLSQDFSAPPVVVVQRDWNIPEDEPVGTRVAQARSPDQNHANLEFGLDQSVYRDGSSFFRIDPKSGAIYLNESMQGKKGEQYYLYVIVSDGQLTAKTEVWVKIGPSISQSNANYTNRPIKNELPIKPKYPSILTPAPGSNIPKASPSDEEILSVNNYPALPSFGFGTTKIPKYNENRNGTNGLDLELSTWPTEVPTHAHAHPPHPVTDSNTNDINGRNHTSSGGFVYNPMNPGPTTSIGHGTTQDGNNQYEPVSANEIGSSKPEGKIDRTRMSPTSQNSKVNEEEDGNYTIVIFTVIPIVIVFALVPIIVGTIWLLRKRSRLNKRPTKELRKESATTTNSSVTMSGEGEPPNALIQWIGKRAQSNRYESYNPDDPGTQVQNRWEFPRHHLQIGGILGEGCFGQVWRCEALNIDGKEGTTTVAVKTLKESATERERSDLLSELAVMKMLDKHPHVVRLLGSCTEKDPIFVIMEYVALGKLQSFLRNSRAQHYYGNLHADSSSLSSKDLTNFAYQVARGMEYLASKGIIHRDLAARNILIDKERTCKVADFGLARDVVANHVYERKTDDTKLPIRWMAPESLYDNMFTTKTDVWSFGVLMWEIVTLGSTPYPGMSAGEVMRKVRDGYRLDKPEHCRRELYNILFYCWAHNPDDRPTFSDLVNFLRHLLFSETDYIELDRFPDHDYYNMNSLSGEKL